MIQAATVHGDVIAFTFLVVLFAAGAVAIALAAKALAPLMPAIRS